MGIKQFRYFNDNLGYLVFSGNEGMVIDAGNIDAILEFANQNNILIKYVTNTHFHSDHTSGNADLLEKTDAQFIDCRKIGDDQSFDIGQEKINVFTTPGHTMDSVTFKARDFIITGDTLFNGTVGNCFSGDLLAFFNSLKRIISLPGDTKVYAGHDYVMESMQVSKTIEKDNPFIDEYIQRYDPSLIVSTLDDELNVNPYIRFNADSMIALLLKKKMPTQTEFDRFKSIMEIF